MIKLKKFGVLALFTFISFWCFLTFLIMISSKKPLNVIPPNDSYHLTYRKSLTEPNESNNVDGSNLEDIYQIIHFYDNILKIKYGNSSFDYSECSNSVGFNLMETWRRNRISVCKDVNLITKEQQTCYQQISSEYPRYLCINRDVRIRTLNDVNNPIAPIRRPTLEFISTTNSTVCLSNTLCSLLEFCIKNSELEESDTTQSSSTDQMIITHPVFWLYRYDHKNIYHYSEDAITTFQSLGVLGYNPKDVELIIYDTKPFDPNSPLVELWIQIFGKGVRHWATNPYPNNTIYKITVGNIYALRSLLTLNGMYLKDTKCQSAILQGYRHWVLNQFNLTNHLSLLNQHKQIVFLSRNLNTSRHIQNEDELLKFLLGLISAKDYDLVIFRPDEITSFRDQISTVMNAHVLIGAHGAGLTHTMFLKSGSSHLIELFLGDRGPENRHFHNIARFAGVKYHSLNFSGQNAVNVEMVLKLLQKVLQ